ncbi:MAG TPA: tetratricopeptide repeat protein, partial [Phycisphaerae bacterium]|nr:tetratricopeptide repeat protein [Phycisphaerae bacterium]
MSEPTIQQSFDLALQHYQAGRLDQARDILGQILAVEPNNSFVLNMLGVIASLNGNNPLAVELINRAITINPLTATFFSNLSV